MANEKRSELWQRLRAARTKSDKTQREVAKHFGISRPAVTLWENSTPGNRTQPTADQISELSKLYGVSAAWLLDDTVNPDDVWSEDAKRIVGGPSAAPRPTPAPAPSPNTAAGVAFFSAVRFAVQARLPTFDSSFDVQLASLPGGLTITAPFLRAGNLVRPCALDASPAEVIAREAPHLLLAERATGRKARSHLMVWAPAGTTVPADLCAAVKEMFGVSVSVFSSVDAAADFILNL